MGRRGYSADQYKLYFRRQLNGAATLQSRSFGLPGAAPCLTQFFGKDLERHQVFDALLRCKLEVLAYQRTIDTFFVSLDYGIGVMRRQRSLSCSDHTAFEQLFGTMSPVRLYCKGQRE